MPKNMWKKCKCVISFVISTMKYWSWDFEILIKMCNFSTFYLFANALLQVLADKIYTSNEFKKVKENFTVSWNIWIFKVRWFKYLVEIFGCEILMNLSLRVLQKTWRPVKWRSGSRTRGWVGFFIKSWFLDNEKFLYQKLIRDKDLSFFFKSSQ